MTEVANAHVGRLLLTTLRPGWSAHSVDYERLKRACRPAGADLDGANAASPWTEVMERSVAHTEAFFVTQTTKIKARVQVLLAAAADDDGITSLPRMRAWSRAADEAARDLADVVYFAALNKAALVKAIGRRGAAAGVPALDQLQFAGEGAAALSTLYALLDHARNTVAYKPSEHETQLLRELIADGTVPTKDGDWIVEAVFVGAAKTVGAFAPDQLANVREAFTDRPLLTVAAMSSRPAAVALVQQLAGSAAGSPAVDWSGQSALVAAAKSHDNAAIVEALLSSSSGDVDQAIFHAVTHNHPSVLRTLLAGSKPASTLVHEAAVRNFDKVLQILIEAGADLSEGNTHGQHALYLASVFGHHASVQVILNSSQAAAVIDKGEILRGRTPLMAAAANGHAAVVSLLVDHKASTDTFDLQGWTAMAHALYRGNLAVVRKLQPLTPVSSKGPQLPAQPVAKPIAVPMLRKDESYVFVKLGGHAFDKPEKPGYDLPVDYLTPGNTLVFAPVNDAQTSYSVLLPALGNPADFLFKQAHKLDPLKIQITLYGLGNKALAHGYLLTASLKTKGSMAVPLVGPAGLVGSVSVDFLVVKPFESVPNTYVEGGAPAWRPIKLIGHRGTGADKYCKEDAHHIPENTIASFTEAFKSVGMVEFDVHVMRDGVPVIYHDFRLGQQAFQAITTDLTVDLLKQYNEQFHKAAPLPTFERLFLELDPSLAFNVEVKYPNSREMEKQNLPPQRDLNEFVEAILAIVFAYKPQNRVIIFSSFVPDVCVLLATKQSTYPVFFLTDAGWDDTYSDQRCLALRDGIRFARSAGLHGIVSWLPPLLNTPVLCGAVKQAGLQLLTYGTDNNNPDVGRRELLELGMDAIIADHVAKVHEGLDDLV